MQKLSMQKMYCFSKFGLVLCRHFKKFEIYAFVIPRELFKLRLILKQVYA